MIAFFVADYKQHTFANRRTYANMRMTLEKFELFLNIPYLSSP